MGYKSKRQLESEEFVRDVGEAIGRLYAGRVLRDIFGKTNPTVAACPACSSRDRGRRDVREGGRRGRIMGYDIFCQKCGNIFYSSVR